METVIQVAEETEMSACRVHNVTRNELDIFLEHLKLISQQANIVISAEIEKHDDVISSLTFSPRGSKGKKISLHYGEVYLLARAISHSDTIPFASLIPSLRFEPFKSQGRRSLRSLFYAMMKVLYTFQTFLMVFVEFPW